MRLRTLGRLQLEGVSFTQTKALTLLAYLALEGPQERHHLAELFWFKATDPLNNLNTALSRIRKGAPGAVEADEVRVSTRLPCDAVELLEANPKGEAETCLALYQGRFLQGVRLQGTSNDLEEWIYATRETLAARAREALLHLAEDSAAAGDFDRTADQAHRAYLLPGAPEPEAEDLERMYALLRAAEHPAATEVRKEAGGYGLNLRLSPSEARASLRLEAEPARREIPHNLPVQPTGFIGREAEMAKLDRLLADPECRLLTITGPGGVGKTRLAIEAVQHQGERYPDGVTFISFVTVTSPTSMPYPIATALDFSFFGPINPKEQLLEHLQDKEMLLVLDNLEHLLSGVHFIGEMLATAPKLKIIATSRERLDLQAERLFGLGGLAVPEQTSADIDNYDAVKLFVQSARNLHPDFELDRVNTPAVIQISQLTGGMPLALELAASWLRVLSPQEIAVEIETGLEPLAASTRDRPERHQSIHAVFDHSWNLLSEEERSVLTKLSIFQGGFTREVASEVAGTTLADLSTLVDKSFLGKSIYGRYEYHPLLHQYLQEKLAEDLQEQANIQERHGQYYLELVQDRAGGLGKQFTRLNAQQYKEALETIHPELPNIKAAWRWASTKGKITMIEQTLQPLSGVLNHMSFSDEGYALFAEAISHLDETEPSHQAVLGHLLIEQSSFCVLPDYPEAIESGQKALKLLRHLGDNQGVMNALVELGCVAWMMGNYSHSQTLFEEGLSLARRHGTAGNIVEFLRSLALVAKDVDHFPNIHQFYRDGLAEVRELADPLSLGFFLRQYGFFLLHDGDLQEASVLEQESYRLFAAFDHEGLMLGAVDGLGMIAYKRGDYHKAEELLNEALAMAKRTKFDFMEAIILGNLAKLATTLGDYVAAERHLVRSLDIGVRIANPHNLTSTLVSLAGLRAAQGQAERAAIWASLALHHPATEKHEKKEARKLLETLRNRLSPEELSTAKERGKQLDLMEVAKEILAAIAAGSSKSLTS